MNKKAKKKWNPPVIASTLSIRKTLNVPGSGVKDSGMGTIMYNS
jgi:hypothetical protein